MRKADCTKVEINPLSPKRTGEKIEFESSECYKGKTGNNLTYYWTFGDGGGSNEANPVYKYLKPGIYPVTFYAHDGTDCYTTTQHITIDGDEIDCPGLSLASQNEHSFIIRPQYVMDVYGHKVRHHPHTVEVTAIKRGGLPEPRIVEMVNTGNGVLGKVEYKVYYDSADSWVKITHTGRGNSQKLIINIVSERLNTGVYKAIVEVECCGVVNPLQSFSVVLYVRDDKPAPVVTIDDYDNDFFKTPYFWVGHHFACWWNKRGYGNFCVLNGGYSHNEEFVRFTPYIEEGKYTTLKKSIHEGFDIGVFEFNGGRDGFVELIADGSVGSVVADAIVFRRVDEGYDGDSYRGRI